MDITERIKIVIDLQKTSANVFNTVVNSLKTGMNEVDIAEVIKQEFKKFGIEEFWYNIPQNVLVGIDRFQIGTTTSDYTIKAPSKNARLEEGSPIFVDLSPMDPATKLWGDWASMIIFRPKKGIDDEQVMFLKEMRDIHRNGIAQITSKTTGADVVNYYLKEFKQREIKLLDVRNNVGHSMHSGPKDKAQRTWLDQNNNSPLGEGIFAVEPGGIRQKKNGTGIIVGRFEECIYIPKEGNAVILGNKELISLTA